MPSYLTIFLKTLPSFPLSFFNLGVNNLLSLIHKNSNLPARNLNNQPKKLKTVENDNKETSQSFTASNINSTISRQPRKRQLRSSNKISELASAKLKTNNTISLKILISLLHYLFFYLTSLSRNKDFIYYKSVNLTHFALQIYIIKSLS